MEDKLFNFSSRDFSIWAASLEMPDPIILFLIWCGAVFFLFKLKIDHLSINKRRVITASVLLPVATLFIWAGLSGGPDATAFGVIWALLLGGGTLFAWWKAD